MASETSDFIGTITDDTELSVHEETSDSDDDVSVLNHSLLSVCVCVCVIRIVKRCL